MFVRKPMQMFFFFLSPQLFVNSLRICLKVSSWPTTEDVMLEIWCFIDGRWSSFASDGFESTQNQPLKIRKRKIKPVFKSCWQCAERLKLTSWWHKQQETKKADQKFAANFFMPAWRNDPNKEGLFKPFCIWTSAQKSLQFVWFLLLFCYFFFVCIFWFFIRSHQIFYSLSNKWRQ